MHWVGFEPTRLTPYELESHPLDHSGTNAIKMNRLLLNSLLLLLMLSL